MTTPAGARTTEFEEFIDAVERSCADLPAPQRRHIIADLDQHLNEIGDRGDVVADLGDPVAYADDLRAALDLPPRPRSTPTASRRMSRPPRRVLIAILVVIGLAATGAVAWFDHDSPSHPKNANPPHPSNANGPAVTRAASVVDHGSITGVTWRLWAQLTPYTGSSQIQRPVAGSTPVPLEVSFSPRGGIQTCVQFIAANGTSLGAGFGAGGDPKTLPTFAFASVGPPGQHFQLIDGITTVPATVLRVTTANQQSFTVTISRTPALPGYGFFATKKPTGRITSLTAEDSNNHVLATATQQQLNDLP